MPYLKVRKYLKKAPLFSHIHETQDGTTLHLNGPLRSAIGLLKRTPQGRLRLEPLGVASIFIAPFAGHEIDDSLPAIRELQWQMSAHLEMSR